MNEHDRALSAAFDSQAERFERAPVQSDPVALERLARKAGFEAGSRVLDAGCGPGLVSEALLHAGCRVVGVDLSREMIERAQKRCGRWGDQAEFQRISVFDSALDGLAPFDGTISRYVLHHVTDAARVRRPSIGPASARRHARLERPCHRPRSRPSFVTTRPWNAHAIRPTPRT